MTGMGLKAKNALVTAGTRRIGRAISLKLADAGVNVVLHYHSEEGEADAKTLSESLLSMGVKSWALQGELSGEASIAEFFTGARSVAGDIDILVNNASVFKEDRILGFGTDAFYEHVNVNSLAPLFLSRMFASGGKSGVIINILDARIMDYDSAHASYHLSKRLLADMTSMLALELAPSVRVNAVAPGLILPPPGKDESYVESRKHTNPLESRGTPEDVADAVMFLAKSGFVTGQIVYVDGGRHLKGRVYES
jgi:pteridine reductase